MQQRTKWIDMAKGIGIILVIIGHISLRPEWLNVFLCSFHMPLFFFLSGITYNGEKHKQFKLLFIKKTQQLLIPYLIFAVVLWLWDVACNVFRVFGRSGNINDCFKSFLGIFLQIRTTDYSIGVWFIPCIFVTFILLFLITKLSKNRKVVYFILSVLAFIIGVLYCTKVNKPLPWGIDAAFVAVFFMAIGNMLRTYLVGDESRASKPKLFMILFINLVLTILFAYLNFTVQGRTVGMWSNSYGNILFFLLGALSGILTIVSFSKILNIRFVTDIGENSIFYYGIHIIILEALTFFTRFVPNIGNKVVDLVVTIVLLLITIVILKILYPFYKRIFNYVLKFVRDR